MKKVLALLLALVLVTATFAACASKESDSSDDADAATESAAALDDSLTDAQGKKISKTDDGKSSKDDSSSKGSDTKVDNSKLADSFDGRKDVAYVMVYNPAVYDEYSMANKKLSTGKLTKWIDTSANRAGGLEEAITNSTVSQKDLMADSFQISGENVTQERAGALVPTYKKGDKQKFFYNPYSSKQFEEQSFTCSYVGKKCYIWTLDKSKTDTSAIEKVAKEFDNTIYDKDVSEFGKPRWAADGAKISILLHPMGQGVAGYFCPAELLTEDEIKAMTGGGTSRQYHVNACGPVIHVHSELVASKKTQKEAYSTVAHEFQHMINFTSALESYQMTQMNTWLNESMSGYIEEEIYPGVQKENRRYDSYYYSDYVRGGQSLYNFDCSYDPYVGVYGSVWLYSEYVEKAAGKDVFSKIHKYWRSSTKSYPTVSAALYNSVSASYKKEVDSIVSYPSSMKFKSKEEQWMSKMTLAFYLSLMKYEKSDPDAYKGLDVKKLLYDQVNAASIEGGGRIIFATKSGEFSIPSDADKSLVYIGFDKNFNQITKVIVK